jgi:DNA-binding transcriptional MerR regulator
MTVSTMERTITYSSADVARIARVTYRQVDYWDRFGVLRPSVLPADGSGTRRRYSEDDLIRAKVISLLLTAGVSLQRVRRCLADPAGMRALGDDVQRAIEALGA